MRGPQNTSAATVDAGVLWQVADLVSIGVAGYNLVPIGNDAVAPMGAGAGVALGNDRTLQVTGDWRTDFDRRGKTTNRYAAGAEVLLGRLVPLRAGWMKDETLDTRWWSIGAGLVTRNGVALDVGYRQSLDDPVRPDHRRDPEGLHPAAVIRVRALTRARAPAARPPRRWRRSRRARPGRPTPRARARR